MSLLDQPLSLNNVFGVAVRKREGPASPFSYKSKIK